MQRIRWAAFLSVIAGVAATVTAQPIPNTIAALGDSITRGYLACGVASDCPDVSWSTGTSDWVVSHHRRIRQHNWKITDHRFNDAKSGVKVADLNRQANLAADQEAEYVTILIGTNDACAATPTSTSTFQTQFQTAMTTLRTRLPNASILVASIPDWYQVWSVAGAAGCAAMVNAPNDAARQAVRNQIIAYNGILSTVCGQYPTTVCRFDGNALFNHAFTVGELASDGFHPSLGGQFKIAELEYLNGFNWSVDVNPWNIGPVDVHFHAGTARKIEQITGNTDGTLLRPTTTQTGGYHINGTDLGSNFEHENRLYFLFGDTQGGTFAAADSFTYTTDQNPFAMHFTVPTMPSDATRFQPVTASDPDAPGQTLPAGGYCVPTGGASRDDDGVPGGQATMYMIYLTSVGSAKMSRSVLARSVDDGMTWTGLFDLSMIDPNRELADEHFLNVSPTFTTLTGVPGLANGDYLLMFGSGTYRNSSVYLAVVPAGAIAAANIKYFAGLVAGAPTWSVGQRNAAPLIDEEVVGELSVHQIAELGNRWVLTYNGPGALLGSGGIAMRTATAPWGPFSAREVIFDMIRDDAYGHFIHDPVCDAGCSETPSAFCTPECDDFGEGSDGGGPYGPYVIPRFTTVTATGVQLYYTLSTWNPYDAVLMRSEVGATQPAENPVSSSMTITIGDAAWSKSSGTWFSPLSFQNGAPGIQTGLPDKGVMARWLPRDRWNRTLALQVGGGNQEFMLLEGTQPLPPTNQTIGTPFYDAIKAGTYGRVVQDTWGHRDGTEVPVVWDLRPFDRMNLKLVLIDKSTSTGVAGNVTVAYPRLDRNAPPIGTPQCGDGVQNQASEECDDGNLIDGDGCDSNCKLTRCGNGITTDGEQCDDANLSNGDCCSSACQFEAAGSVCRASIGPCDVAETCSGVSGVCPADMLVANGTPCTDNNTCTTGDVCSNGSCVGTCSTGTACSGSCGGTCGGASCTCQ